MEEKESVIKKLRMLVLLPGLLGMVAVTPVAAQDYLRVDFQAPATFYAGNAKLPAGAYTVSQMSSNSICVITSKSGAHSVLLDCRHSSKSPSGNAPEVLFNRYGNMDYLESVLTPGGTSVDFSEEIAEKLAAKSGTPQPHSVKGN